MAGPTESRDDEEQPQDAETFTASREPHQLREFEEKDGYVVEAGDGDVRGVKMALDGRTRLMPQPSDDPNDPLNWPWSKKHIILVVVALTALLPDYGSATGAVVLIPQAMQWHLTEDYVNHSQVGNVFMLGAGGIFAVILSAYFGRYPVVFYYLIIATATAAWCAGASSFQSFMAARILNGFFSTVTQAGGLMFIQDMFFFHERARKINIWASFFVISPYMGPLLAAFITAFKPWPTPFWVYTAETALCLVLTIVLLDETYYDRRIPQSEQPPRGGHIGRLIGVAQFRSRKLRNSFPAACWRCISVLLKPVVLLICFYYILTFAWVVGINTTLSVFLTPLYNFGPKQIGFFYFTPVVATILGEIAGHWLHDLLAWQYIRSHNGHFEPEVRLRAIFISVPFLVVGLVILGQALQHSWHYMGAAIGWGIYVFGIMITTVAVSSYCLDSYPEASGEVGAWVNNSRTIGGFIVSYFQIPWAAADGPAVSLGIQAAICGGALIIPIFLIFFGKRLRVWAGPLHFSTA